MTKSIPFRHFSYLTLFAATWLVLFFTAPALQAQSGCSRLGKVITVMPDCGVVVLDLNTSELLLAVEGGSNLSGNQVLMFEAEPSTVSPVPCGLQGAFNAVALTCLSTDFPCEAKFAYTPDPENPLKLRFKALQPELPGYEYTWDFGDGTSGAGYETEHEYAAESTPKVCMKISSPNGCSDERCATVGAGAPLSCGYTAQVTAIGTQLYGKLASDGSNDLALTQVQWYSSKSTSILSDAPVFNASVPLYGDYTVCAFYETQNPADGSTCAATSCVNLTVLETNTCQIPAMVQPTAICAPTSAPVCGCDTQQYPNECAAVNAGVTTWWAGPCNQNNLLECRAEMEVTVLSFSPDNGYTVQFKNLSNGLYTAAQLDFGDGTPFYTLNQWDVVTHQYASGDIYRTNLTVWKNLTAVSSFTHFLVTDAYSMDLNNLPAPTDYVLPGDANGDKKANMHDALYIGASYYSVGVPRPNAHNNWIPQFSPNWENKINGVNLKHVDCDGNGSVNDFDAPVILDNYTALDTLPAPVLTDAPKVWVQFAKDTIEIDPNNPQALEIEADLRIGSPSKPALGLYGAAMTLKYPDFTNHDPDFYYSSDFFGAPLQVLPLTKDLYNRRQFDLGIVRKNGEPVSGYGTMAKLNFRSDFIIIVDIIDRADGKYVPFTVPVRNLKGIGADGSPKLLSEPAVLDTLWLKLLDNTSGLKNTQVQDQVQLYPNPATDEAAVYTGELQVLQLELFNSLGQKVRQIQPSGARQTRIPVQDLRAGVYTLRVTTPDGIAEKRLSVQ